MGYFVVWSNLGTFLWWFQAFADFVYEQGWGCGSCFRWSVASLTCLIYFGHLLLSSTSSGDPSFVLLVTSFFLNWEAPMMWLYHRNELLFEVTIQDIVTYWNIKDRFYLNKPGRVRGEIAWWPFIWFWSEDSMPSFLKLDSCAFVADRTIYMFVYACCMQIKEIGNIIQAGTYGAGAQERQNHFIVVHGKGLQPTHLLSSEAAILIPKKVCVRRTSSWVSRASLGKAAAVLFHTQDGAVLPYLLALHCMSLNPSKC